MSHNSAPSGRISSPRAVLKSSDKNLFLYFMVHIRMVAIWRKDMCLKKRYWKKSSIGKHLTWLTGRSITRPPVDGFQIRGQFWNPWTKIFFLDFIVHIRMVAISHKNKRLKKRVLKELAYNPHRLLMYSRSFPNSAILFVSKWNTTWVLHKYVTFIWPVEVECVDGV